MVKNRDAFADFCKGLLIIFVVFGHLCQFIYPGDVFQHQAVKLISMFFMPLFIAISGYYTYYSLNRKTASVFLKERILYLLIPLLLWGTIMGITDIFLSYLGVETQFSRYKDLTKTFYIFATTISSYWFVWTVLIHSVIMGFLKILKLNNNIYIIVLICLAAMLIPLPWNIVSYYNLAFTFAKDMFCFFLIGYLLAFFDIRKIYSFCKKYFLIFLALFIFSYSIWETGALIYFSRADIFHLKLSLLRFFGGIVTSVTFLLIIYYIYTKYSKGSKCIEFIASLGKITLGIYFIQGILFSSILVAYPVSSDFSSVPSSVMLIPTMLIVVVIYFIIKLIEKSNVAASLFLGQKFKKNLNIKRQR